VSVIAKGGAVQITGQLMQGGLSFVFVAIAVRILGTADYGLFRQAVQALATAGQIGLLGFNYSAMRFIARSRATGNPGGVRGAAWIALTSVSVTSGVGLFALLIGADSLAAQFADHPARSQQLATLLRIGALFVPLFALTQVLRYCTQAYKTMVPSVIVGNIIQPAARFVLGVGFLLIGFGVAGVVAAHVTAAGIAAIAGAWFFRRILTPIERSAPPHAHLGSMARFALLQGGSSLLGVQTLGLAVLVLGVLGTDREVGLMGIALALQTPGTIFLGGVVNIWAPMVTDLYERGEIERLQSLYQTVTRWVATLSFPVFVALILEPELYVEAFVGDNGEGAAGVVALLAVGNLLYTGTGPTGFVLSMTGRPGINFINSIAAVALYIGLGALVVPQHGAVGMAAVDASVTALINGARVVEAKLLVGVHPFGHSLRKPLVAAAGAAAVMLIWSLVPGKSLLLDGAGLVLGGLVYVVTLAALGLDAEERHVWKRTKSRVLARFHPGSDASRFW
jgi:O-antigen/teichoic acid export membrane protein